MLFNKNARLGMDGKTPDSKQANSLESFRGGFYDRPMTGEKDSPPPPRFPADRKILKWPIKKEGKKGPPLKNCNP